MTSATLSQEIAAALTVEIVSGSLGPGMRLDEASIAKRFKVSRTPVRDALRWLAASGLVEFAPRRGCSVMPVDSGKLKDAYEAYSEVESLCARLCALRAGVTEREQLSVLHDQARAAAAQGDFDRYTDINDLFHDAIYVGTQNKTLQKIATDLRRQVSQSWSRVFYEMENSQAEHQVLLDAILAKDGDAAGAAMMRHTSRVAFFVLSQIAKTAGTSASGSGIRARRRSEAVPKARKGANGKRRPGRPAKR